MGRSGLRRSRRWARYRDRNLRRHQISAFTEPAGAVGGHPVDPEVYPHAEPEAAGTPFGALRHRDFALFWSAAIISNTGTWMQTVTVPYVLYQMTHSTLWLGLAAFASFFPGLLLGPISGSLADRFPRQRVVMICQIGLMIASFLLWGAYSAGAGPTVLLLIVVASAALGGINIASWQSFVTQLVPTRDMLSAVRLNSVQFTGARAFGPALAGLVLARFGAGTAFMFNAVTFVLVIVALKFVRPRKVAVIAAGGSVIAHFREGLSYIRARTSLILPVLTMTVLSLLGSSVVQLAPALADDEFHVGKAAYGILVAAFGFGAITASLTASFIGDRLRRSSVTRSAMFGVACGVVLLGIAPGYVAGLAAIFVMGVGYVFCSVSLNTSIQAGVDETFRGRVLAVYLMGLMGALPIGALIQGKAAQIIGLRATVVTSGVLLAFFAVYVIVRFDRLRPLDGAVRATDPQPATPSPTPAPRIATPRTALA